MSVRVLVLNDPADWYHDHGIHQTGYNVMSGLTGMYPMYVPGDDKEKAMPHYVSQHPYQTL